MADVPTQVVEEDVDFDFNGIDDENTSAAATLPAFIFKTSKPKVVASTDPLPLNFGKPRPDNNLQIKIGSYYFTLIETTNSIIGYETIRILSYISEISEKYDFWCYRSHSELGIWRFGTVNPENVREFYKGPDKVQTTLIHLELQQFINNNMRYMVIVETIPFTKANLIAHNLTTFSNEPMFVDISRDPKYNVLINSTDRQTRKLEPFNTINKQITCGHKNFTDITKVLDQFSVNFKKSYTIVHTTNIIPNYSYTFEDIFTATGHIYETILASNDKTTHPDVLLYFFRSHFTNISNPDNHLYPHIDNICSKPYHIMPILLTTTRDINLLGVYEQYISAGIYICKELDKSASCKADENRDYRVTRDYTYIGYRYDNLFPYVDIIYERVQPLLKEEGKEEERIHPLGKGKEKEKNNITPKKQKQKTKKNKKKRSKKRKGKKKNKSKKYGVRAM